MIAQHSTRIAVLGAALAMAVLAGGGPAAAPARAEGGLDGGTASSRARVWSAAGGAMALVPDRPALEALGLQLATVTQTAVLDSVPALDSVFAAGDEPSLMLLTYDGRFRGFLGGSLQTTGELLLAGPEGAAVSIGDLLLVRADPSEGPGWSVVDTLVSGEDVLRVTSHGMVALDLDAGEFGWNAVEFALTDAFARRLGLEGYAGQVVVRIFVRASLAAVDVDPSRVLGVTAGRRTPVGPDTPIGPNVIVGDIYDPTRWGSVGSIAAYSIGTVSCNTGDEPLSWIAETNQHPVITQGLFRLKDGAFEQIGMSWLKHGFFALSDTFCFPDCEPTDGSALGVHCSDPYSGSLNGSTSRLGPHFEVNASTGEFPYPFTSPPVPPTIGRRLQVHISDIDPSQNPGAKYYAEAMYIHPDDAAMGNNMDNASYRQVQFGSGPTYPMSFVTGQSTVQMEPAIEAWAVEDPAATVRYVDAGGVLPDGRYFVGYKTTDNQDGTWHYEYAIYNMNSHRSGQAFRVPVPEGATITNVGFHDVDYHSGEPYTNVDWTSRMDAGYLVWETETFQQNEDANALRFATQYNFRFDADAPPRVDKAYIVFFRPGTPDDVTVAVDVPGLDCNQNGIEDASDDIVVTLELQGATTVPPGGDLFLDVGVKNHSGETRLIENLVANVLPWDSNPVAGPKQKTFAPGQSILKTGKRLPLPAGLTAGDYLLEVACESLGVRYCAQTPFTVQ